MGRITTIICWEIMEIILSRNPKFANAILPRPFGLFTTRSFTKELLPLIAKFTWLLFDTSHRIPISVLYLLSRKAPGYAPSSMVLCRLEKGLLSKEKGRNHRENVSIRPTFDVGWWQWVQWLFRGVIGLVWIGRWSRNHYPCKCNWRSLTAPPYCSLLFTRRHLQEDNKGSLKWKYKKTIRSQRYRHSWTTSVEIYPHWSQNLLSCSHGID